MTSEFSKIYSILKPHQKYIVDKIISNYDKYQYFIISSPTGTGKTLTMLALNLWLREQHGYVKTGWYTRTINEYYPIVRDIAKFNIDIKVLPILGKDRVCRNPLRKMLSHILTTDVCRECHYNKNIKIPELINKYIELKSPIELVKLIPKNVCPYYTLLLTSTYADIILMTYPYLFGLPKKVIESYNKFTLTIVDEAHNIENIPQILSLYLSIDSLTTLQRNNYNVNELIKLHVNIINEAKIKYVPKELFMGALMNIDSRLQQLCINPQLLQQMNEQFINAISEFCNFISSVDVPYFDIYATRYGFKMMVTDPYQIINNLFQTKTVLMSGSLPTKEYINKVWGIDGLYIDIEKELNFEFGERKWYIASDTTSKLALRNKYTSIMREYVDKLLSKTEPIQLVVFPSYEYMNKFTDIAIKHRCITEREHTKIDEVINAVKHQNIKCIFAVAGGKLTEGVELVDESGHTMIKTIIMVGVPYPEPSEYLTKKTEKLMKRLTLTIDKKYRYLFHEPALILTKQAIGRGIRHDNDKNIILLLDWRYRYFINDLNIKQFIEIVLRKQKQ